MKNKPRIYYLEWEAELYLSHSIWLAPLEDLLYRRLIDAWWIHKGLPNNKQKLAGYARYPQADFDKYWTNVSSFFYEKGENNELLGHEFLEGKLEKCLRESSVKSESGKAGARARWQRHSKANANAIAKDGYTDIDTDIKEKVEKEKNRASPSTVDFSKIKGLNLDAWDEWLAYRSKMKFKKYKTTSLAKKIAKLPKLAQLNCIEHSIENQYQGLFPDKFSKPIKPASTGNGYDQPPPRAQPPDASSLKNKHTKKWTQAERNNAKKLIRQAKDKAGIPSEPDEKQPSYDQPTMVELLMAAKTCYAAFNAQGTDCGNTWETFGTQQDRKCYQCEKFERQRNGPAKKDSTKALGDLI